MNDEIVGYELSARQCAEVALYMYGNYKEEMSKPRFSIPSFEEWCKKIVDHNDIDVGSEKE